MMYYITIAKYYNKNHMKKRGMFWVFVVMLGVLLINFLPAKNSLAASGDSKAAVTLSKSVPSALAYRAIVKVKTYANVNNDNLEKSAEGSGVIISATGLVLTNDHVVSLRSDYNNGEYATSYQICLSPDISTEPSCDYLAKLVARDENKDVALLQIVSYPKGKDLVDFPYLNLSQTDSVNINDTITAIGYPSIGGDTVTITQGVVSGKEDEFGNKWLKTDAASSFGSSGGAAINANGEVIGITTAVHSDASGKLGFILSAVSLNDWINQNLSSPAQDSPLFDRLAALTHKQEVLQTSNDFVETYPNFSFNKPDSWTFQSPSEDMVNVADKSDQDGGDLTIRLLKAPLLLDKSYAKPLLMSYINANNLSSVAKFSKETDVKISGVASKAIVLSVNGTLFKSYLIPQKEYLLWVTYHYGENDKDKTLVDNMIKSLSLSGGGPKFTETHKYTSVSPKFTLKTDASWPIMTQGNKMIPVKLQNKNVKEAFVMYSLEKLDDTKNKMSANELLAAAKDRTNSTNQLSSLIDSKYVIEKTGTNFKINNTVKATYYIDGTERTVSQNSILAFDRDYYVKIGDTLVDINLTVYTSNKATFNKAVTEFNKMLQGMTLK